jgi:hypothetical protein
MGCSSALVLPAGTRVWRQENVAGDYPDSMRVGSAALAARATTFPE